MNTVVEIQCERCEEITPPHCTHGRSLCAECLWACRSCVIEVEDWWAYQEEKKR